MIRKKFNILTKMYKYVSEYFLVMYRNSTYILELIVAHFCKLIIPFVFYNLYKIIMNEALFLMENKQF